MYGGRFLTSKMEAWSAQRLDVKLRAAGWRPASSGAPLAAHPIMPVQVARRRANSRRGSRLGRREKRGRTVNFNAELGRARAVCEFHDGFLNVVGKVDGNKPIPGVEIVLALFVNHAKHIVFFGGRILK